MSIKEILWTHLSVQKLLWASGILALIAIAFPPAVWFGFLLVILPGLALLVAPTVFLYTATFAIVRRYLRIGDARARNVVAAFITVALGVLAPLPMWLAGSRTFHEAATGDVDPPDRVVLRGDVLLNDQHEPRTQYVAGKPYTPCDALCAALLDTPGVSTVTIETKDAPVSYRLVPKGEATAKAMALKEPEEILEYLPAKSFDRADFAAYNARVNAMKARWGFRLANEATLSIVPSPAHHDLTITLSSKDRQQGHAAFVKQVDVRDRQGRLLLRRQHVAVARVFVPLILAPGTRWWGPVQMDVETRDSLGYRNPITVLFEDTTLASPSGPGEAATGARDRLAAAVMQPGAPADLALAGPWLRTIDYQSITDRDLELLGKLIADARVNDLSDLYAGYSGHVRAELRGPIVARLLNPTTPGELRRRLDTVVRFMPPGTFAVPTPDEVALRHNPVLRSPGLIERLADQGKAAVPELLRILQEDLRGEPWPSQQAVVTAVRVAFVRLGPDAASALPAVIALFDQPETPLAVSSEQMDKWRIAMVCMGRPIEDVPFPPERTAQIARSRSNLMRSVELARQNPDWAR